MTRPCVASRAGAASTSPSCPSTCFWLARRRGRFISARRRATSQPAAASLAARSPPPLLIRHHRSRGHAASHARPVALRSQAYNSQYLETYEGHYMSVYTVSRDAARGATPCAADARVRLRVQ